MSEARVWKVSELADLAHVTVRTLHHYDDIGLLVPSERSRAGYRLYTAADVDRLFRILVYRELHMPLESIGAVLDAPASQRRAVLLEQRGVLVEKRRRTEAVLRALDRILQETDGGTPMSDREITEGFDALANAPADIRAHHAQHEAEVRDRWGDTDAYHESMRRARSYSPDEWQQIRAEAEAGEAHMVDLLAAGVSVDSEQAMDGAERLREHISRWFYPCSRVMHSGMADMYEADPRFAAHYDERADGLAAFVAGAIRANASRTGP